MANNFFGKIRNLVSSAWAEADVQPTHYEPVAAAPAAQAGGKLSSVERYLAKQAAAQGGGAETKALTGVEKYLARINPTTQEASAPQAPMSSVEKYLARQAAGGAAKAEPAKPAAPLSKVDKYLAGQSSAPAKAAPAKSAPAKKAEAPAKTPAAKKKSEVAEKAAEATKTAVSDTAPKAKAAAPKTAAPKKTAPSAKKPVGVTDLSVGATQCQAGTAKGTQCRNTLRLNQLPLTLDGKDYLFAACNQHNNEAFKPFQAV